MEGMVCVEAKWISFTGDEWKEMNASQNACMIVSMKAREKAYDEFLSNQDSQVWQGVPKEWQQYYRGKLLG